MDEAFNQLYLAGANDALFVYNTLSPDKRYCLPQNLALTSEQASDILRRWAKKQTSNLEEALLAQALLYALQETFSLSKIATIRRNALRSLIPPPRIALSAGLSRTSDCPKACRRCPVVRGLSKDLQWRGWNRPATALSFGHDLAAAAKAVRPPSGPLWVHEIKYDGYRLMVRRDGARVRSFTRNGHDWADRFPAIVDAALRIKASSFLIDGEAVITRDDGTPDFRALRGRRRGHEAVLYAFDLIEHDGDDLRDLPLIKRKRRLAKLIGKAKRRAIRFNEHLTGDGPTVFEHVCRMGLEGIVSKRVDSRYRSGPSKMWLKSKNPASAAVRREREEEWH